MFGVGYDILPEPDDSFDLLFVGLKAFPSSGLLSEQLESLSSRSLSSRSSLFLRAVSEFCTSFKLNQAEKEKKKQENKIK